MLFVLFFFFKQKTAYEMRISDWSSDVCSSDLEEIIVAPAQDVHRSHNGLPIVSDDADLLQPDALDIQPKRDLGNIPVLSPARQYLVPDHDKGGGPDAAFSHKPKS